MDKKDLLTIQTQRGAKAIGYDNTLKDLNIVISECRKVIEDKSDNYRYLKAQDKREAITQIIIDFVMENKPLVKGYIDAENRPDTNKLVDKLVEDITDYGILSSAILNDKVFEIRCNGKEIKVEIEGRVTDLIDKDGHIVSFESLEQQEVILRRLLGDIRLTPKDALVNARTVEGFRMAAVHYKAVSPDPQDPTATRYNAFVLRKFNKNKMRLSDIVLKGSMSDNMARTLALATAGSLTTFCVGPTASGKTSLLNALLQSARPNDRIVLIQNPSEIDVRFKDSTGRVFNDVLHLEASDIEKPTTKDPTMNNLLNHLLRLSPTYAVIGEMRSNAEMALAAKIQDAGHPVFASLHAPSSKGAVQRYLRGYMADSGEKLETALPGITEYLNLIVVQKIMRDGTRKVLQITEVLGVDKDNPNQAALNDLFIFKPTGLPIYDKSGNLKSIPGVHKRVGQLSERTVAKLDMEGVPPSKFDFLMREIEANEIETYTGEMIEEYGMDRIVMEG